MCQENKPLNCCCVPNMQHAAHATQLFQRFVFCIWVGSGHLSHCCHCLGLKVAPAAAAGMCTHDGF